MDTIKEIKTREAPRAIGPYSQAVKAGGWLFCSGQIAIDPATHELITGGISEQTRQVIKNISAVLSAAGLTLDDVVKTEIFLKNLDDFEEMNLVYSAFFGHRPLPARLTVEISRLPKNALLEISCIAYLNNNKLNI